MAILQATVFSRSLMRNVPLTVILPVDKLMSTGRREFQTLYLLHGIMGNTLDWLTGTRVGRWAMERDLCVVMPSGDNSFYVDDPDRFDLWSQFVGQELVELTRRMFPLSGSREDTYLGGLSMGGYGALYNGLKYHETFSWILAFSAALRLEELRDHSHRGGMLLSNRNFAERCFGNLEQAVCSEKNPAWLVETLHREGIELPRMYLACGDRDELLPGTQRFVQTLVRLGIPHQYELLPGAHEWDFWDRALERALQVLPLHSNRRRRT